MARPAHIAIRQFYEAGGYIPKRESTAEKRQRIQQALYGSSQWDRPGMAGGGLMDVMRAIKKAHGLNASRRLERAADSVDLSRFAPEALDEAFNKRNPGLISIMKPSEFEKYAYPLPREWQEQVPYTGSQAGLNNFKGSYDDYIKGLQDVAKSGGGFDQTPGLWFSPFKQAPGDTGLKVPVVSAHDGRHRMRALAGMGDDPTIVNLLREKSGSLGRMTDDAPLQPSWFRQDRMVLPQQWEPDQPFMVPKVQLPEDLFADGGRVGLNRYGSVMKALRAYKDPASKFIEDWRWRPAADVAKDVPREVPEHVLQYGDFMRAMSKRAGEGFDTRDPLKAYTTTLSSIQRQAINRDKLDLPLSSTEQMIRPEGAFSDWLGTKPGQRYLQRGAEGEADPEAIADMAKRLQPFGLMPSLSARMAEAPGLIAGKEGRLSELVDRASRSASDPGEWRDAVNDLPGIGPAKAGFMASLLGRGDIPTLDARQVILHTGQPTAASKPFLNKANRATEGVDRLANRQSAFGLELPPEYDPYYQHLAHHSIWDAAGDETTTHSDLIDSMLNRRRGGRIGFAKGTLVKDTVQAGVDLMKRIYGTEQKARKAVAAVPEQNLAEHVAQQTGKTPEQVIEDLRTRKAGVRGAEKDVTGITSQMGTPYAEATASMHHPDPVDWPRPKVTDLEDMVGGVGVSGMSDRTRAGSIIGSYGGVPLKEPLITSGGSDYPLFHHNLWASDPRALNGMLNALNDEGLMAQMKKRGIDPESAQQFYFNKLMGRQQSADQSHMAQVLAAHALETAPMSRATRAAFDQSVRDYRKTISGEYVNPLPDYPGSASKRQLSYLLSQPMSNRAGLLEAMDAAKLNAQGVPNPSGIRLALMDPQLHNLPEGTVGRTIGRIDRDNPIDLDPQLAHPSYRAGFRGEQMGSLEKPMMPWELFPDWWKGKDPTKATTMSSWRTAPATQIFDQQWLDTAAPALERSQMRWGQARGGPTPRTAFGDGGVVGARRPTRDQLRYHTSQWQEDWA